MEEETMHKSTWKIQYSCKPRMLDIADVILENIQVQLPKHCYLTHQFKHLSNGLYTNNPKS